MNTVFGWLDKASRCGDVEIQMAAETLKNYYQGVSPQDLCELEAGRIEYLKELDRQDKVELETFVKTCHNEPTDEAKQFYNSLRDKT